MRARLYDGRTPVPRDVTIAIEGSGSLAHLAVRAEQPLGDFPLTSVGMGERVGAVQRLLQLPDGSSLEVLDNPQFDAALEAAGLRTPEQGLRRLEGRWRYALGALTLTALLTVWLLLYGLPALARHALRVIPPSVDAYIGADTLRVLDQATFQPSELSAARQDELRRVFAEVTAGAAPDSARYRLEFRRGGAIGANALALPDGIVVLTDELEKLAVNDDELRGVLAHEVGHLVNRHAMRTLVQSSGAALVVVGLLGDANGAYTLAAAAPATLVNAAYSRDFEREADAFAFAWMKRHGIDPLRLADLLRRLSANRKGAGSGFFDSHPGLEERVRAAAAAARDPR